MLITIDTLRHDAFDAEQMPATSVFAAGGLRLDRFYAASSSTQPTHATLFTGMHPWQHGVTRNGLVLADEWSTLAERLSDAGWTTAAIVSSFPLEARFGFSQGFAHYDDAFTELRGPVWAGEQVDGSLFSTLGGTVVDRAIALLDDATDSRQFFWFHFFDPHEPYGDADRATEIETLRLQDVLDAFAAGDDDATKLLERARERYAADVRTLDHALGRLFERLETDVDIRTHVVFTTDHGESFGEGGSLGHGKRLTPEQLLVPTFIVSPRAVPALRKEVAGTADVTTTVLALAELAHDDIPGRDLLDEVPRQPVAFGMRRTFDTPYEDVRTDGRIATVDAPSFFTARADGLVTGHSGAVLHADDPQRPVAPEQSGAFSALFARFAKELEGVQADDNGEASTREALRALGYVR